MKRDLAATPAVESPSRLRYGVLGFVCSLSMITYLDRVCISSASTAIIEALHLNSEADLNLVFTAFTLSYALFEIPTGWLGDVFGPRNVLIRIVLWWSAFTALTGLAGLQLGGLVLGFWSLVLIRFLFGIGEAGAYPNITRALHNWFPFHERGLAQGAVWMSGRLMGGLTPLVWVLLVERTQAYLPHTYNWRMSFWFFGAIGIVWCILFARWFRNRPEEKAGVNQAELQLIHAGRHDGEAGHERVPWLALFTNANLWALCLMYFCTAYGWYFNITYLPRFLEGQYAVKPDSFLGAVYKGGPLWMGAIGCLLGGWLTDRFIRRTGNRKWGRRFFGIVGHGLCALCYLSCLFTSSAFTFFLAVSLAAFCNDLTMGASWAVCQDIGKRYAAIVAGCMNTIGNLGGTAATFVTGSILTHTLAAHALTLDVEVVDLLPEQKKLGLFPGYEINFLIFAVVYLIAVVLWFRIDSTQPVVQDSGQ